MQAHVHGRSPCGSTQQFNRNDQKQAGTVEQQFGIAGSRPAEVKNEVKVLEAAELLDWKTKQPVSSIKYNGVDWFPVSEATDGTGILFESTSAQCYVRDTDAHYQIMKRYYDWEAMQKDVQIKLREVQRQQQEVKANMGNVKKAMENAQKISKLAAEEAELNRKRKEPPPPMPRRTDKDREMVLVSTAIKLPFGLNELTSEGVARLYAIFTKPKADAVTTMTTYRAIPYDKKFEAAISERSEYPVLPTPTKVVQTFKTDCPTNRWQSTCVLNADTLVLAGKSGKLRKIEMKSNRITVYEDPKDRNASIVRIDNNRYVTGTDEGKVKVWDMSKSMVPICGNTADTHKWAIFNLTILHDGRIVTCGEDSFTKVWRYSERDNTIELDFVLAGHTSRSQGCVQMIDDPYYALVTANIDKTLKVWNSVTGELEKTIQHNSEFHCIVGLEYPYCVTGCYDDRVNVWDISEGKCVVSSNPQGACVEVMTMLPKDRIVTGHGDGSISIWQLSPKRNQITPIGGKLKEHGNGKQRVTAVKVLPDGRLMSADDTGLIRIWA